MDGLQTTSGMLRAVARTVLDFGGRKRYKRVSQTLDHTHSVDRKSSHKLEELIAKATA